MGDKTTFGKGTVQTILGVADHMPFFSARDRAGSLKVTIQKFYRIAGGSTQREGVKADVVLPSRYDAMDVGESFLKEPLPYDTIKEMTYRHGPRPIPFRFRPARPAVRPGRKNPEFSYVADYVARTQDLIRKNTLSLNEAPACRKTQVNEARVNAQKEERKARIAEANKGGDPYKVFPLTLDTVGEVTLKTDAETKAAEKDKPKTKASS